MSRSSLRPLLAAALLALAACAGSDAVSTPPAAAPVARVELTPSAGALTIGRTLSLAAVARDAAVATAHVAGGSGAYSCAIAADRLTTVCWGRNDEGQLGNGTTTSATAVSATAVSATPSIVVGQRPLAVR